MLNRSGRAAADALETARRALVSLCSAASLPFAIAPTPDHVSLVDDAAGHVSAQLLAPSDDGAPAAPVLPFGDEPLPTHLFATAAAVATSTIAAFDAAYPAGVRPDDVVDAHQRDADAFAVARNARAYDRACAELALLTRSIGYAPADLVLAPRGAGRYAVLARDATRGVSHPLRVLALYPLPVEQLAAVLAFAGRAVRYYELRRTRAVRRP